MKKKSKKLKWTLISILIILVLSTATFFLKDLIFTAFDDGMTIDDGFDDNVLDTEKYEWDTYATVGDGDTLNIAIEEKNGKLYYPPVCKRDVSCSAGTYKILKNYIGRDVKISATSIPGCVDGKNRGFGQINWIVNGKAYIGVNQGGYCNNIPPVDSVLEIIQIIGTNEYVIKVNGLVVATDSSGDIYINVAGGFSLEDIKYEIPFDCSIDPDEVIVREFYAVGSTINLEDLTYAPTPNQAFCKDIAPIWIGKDGIENDDQGIIFSQIVYGEGYTVPPSITVGLTEFELSRVQFQYITPFVTGMDEACQGRLDMAIDADGNCITTVEQIAPTEVILQCVSDEDCFLPTWRCGEDLTVSCIENLCEYSQSECTPEQIINEVIVYEKVIELINTKTTEIISIGTNQIQFNHNVNTDDKIEFGDKTLYMYKPNYIEGCDSISAGYVNNPECFKVNVNFDGNIYNLISNKETKLNDHLSVVWMFNGRGVRYQDGAEEEFNNEEDWGNLFIFTIDTDNIFDLIMPKDEPIQLELNSKKELVLTLIGNMANFENAGFIIGTDYRLLQQEEKKEIIKIPLLEGNNNYNINLETEQHGLVIYTITPYFEIIADKIYRFVDDTTLQIPYEIKEEITIEIEREPEQEPEVIETEEEPVVVKEDGSTKLIVKTKDTKTSWIISFVIIIVIALILLFLIRLRFKKKKKRK